MKCKSKHCRNELSSAQIYRRNEFCSKSCAAKQRGFSLEALQKGHEVTRSSYKSGRLIIWNKGLTKETDPRVMSYAQTKKGHGHSQTRLTRMKIAESTIKRKIEAGQWHSIGRNEKQLLDKQEQKDSCKILRQYVVGKFVVDGYDPSNNVVYEVYERHHQQQIEKDLQRQKEIQQRLGCRFVVIKDDT